MIHAGLPGGAAAPRLTRAFNPQDPRPRGAFSRSCGEQQSARRVQTPCLQERLASRSPATRHRRQLVPSFLVTGPRDRVSPMRYPRCRLSRAGQTIHANPCVQLPSSARAVLSLISTRTPVIAEFGTRYAVARLALARLDDVCVSMRVRTYTNQPNSVARIARTARSVRR